VTNTPAYNARILDTAVECFIVYLGGALYGYHSKGRLLGVPAHIRVK